MSYTRHWPIASATSPLLPPPVSPWVQPLSTAWSEGHLTGVAHRLLACAIFACLSIFCPSFFHETAKGKKEDLSTSARRKKVDTSVTWLKKTVYLTNDPFDPVHQFKSEQQAQVGKLITIVTIIIIFCNISFTLLVLFHFFELWSSVPPLCHSPRFELSILRADVATTPSSDFPSFER